jgi:hypothetical protein
MHTAQSALLCRALAQRNQAIACAILSIILSLAIIMNTFLGHRKELVEANREILILQNNITNVENALRANQQELLRTQDAVRQLQAALAHSTQKH